MVGAGFSVPNCPTARAWICSLRRLVRERCSTGGEVSHSGVPGRRLVEGLEGERAAQRHWTPVRYALAVTLDILEDIDIDVYTPIANLIAVPVVGT